MAGPEQIFYKGTPPQMVRAKYNGTEQLEAGYAMCYDTDRGVAADSDPERVYVVEKPSVTNIARFAGIVRQKPVVSGETLVDLIIPGSVAQAHIFVSATVDVTRMTVMAGQWYLKQAGFPGAGSALALQTVNRSGTAGLCQVLLDDGPQSGGVEEIQPPTTGATGTTMDTGITYLVGTVTIASQDHVLTQADGLYIGQLKSIFCQGTFSTSDVIVSFTSHITSDPEERFFEAANEQTVVMWNGFQWEPLSDTADDS